MIRDLDDITTKEEICERLAEELGVDEESLNYPIKSLRDSYVGTQMEVVRLTSDLAEKIVEAGKIRIGWVVWRVREQLKPTKCFKCWQYGHLTLNCKESVDRSNLCMKCGKTGHRVGESQVEADCILCEADAQFMYRRSRSLSVNNDEDSSD